MASSDALRALNQERLQALLKPWSSGPGAGQSRRQDPHDADKVICIDRTTRAVLGTWRIRHDPERQFLDPTITQRLSLNPWTVRLW